MIEKLKEIKDHYGWSYKDLEDATGIDDSVLNNYINGKYDLNLRNYKLLVKFIDNHSEDA